MTDTLVVASAGLTRRGCEPTVAALLATITMFIDDGYAPEELIIEGITR